MSENKANKDSLFKRLQSPSRYVRLNSLTFEEEKSFTLSAFNILIYILFGAILVIALSFLLFSYTPLNQLIPNVSSNLGDSEQLETDKQNISDISQMGETSVAQTKYNDNLIALLNGETKESTDDVLPPTATTQDYSNIKFTESKEDSILRARIEAEEKYSIHGNSEPDERDDKMNGVFFFTPLEGDITNSFGGETGHHGIDIIAPKNEAVKSTLDGTVIFAGWTTDNGHIIQVQHAHNLVSIYKHNSVLLKEEGDKVTAGEPIGIVGNTGDLSTGAHLHFELWYNGNPINPQEFIAF
jgi:murein DD-endopeptidase MepM/ murein hydrolase activator NlpD